MNHFEIIVIDQGKARIFQTFKLTQLVKALQLHSAMRSIPFCQPDVHLVFTKGEHRFEVMNEEVAELLDMPPVTRWKRFKERMSVSEAPVVAA